MKALFLTFHISTREIRPAAPRSGRPFSFMAGLSGVISCLREACQIHYIFILVSQRVTDVTSEDGFSRKIG
jgi:hypothetical protein